MQYLHPRSDGIYQVEVPIPKHLQGRFLSKKGTPQRSLRESTGERVLAKAERIAAPIIARFLKDIERAELPTTADILSNVSATSRYKDGDLGFALQIMAQIAEVELAAERMTVPEIENLIRLYAEQITVLRGVLERAKAKTTVAAEVAATVDSDMTITMLLERWRETQKPTPSYPLQKDFEASVRRLVSIIGDKQIRTVTSADCRTFRDFLAENTENTINTRLKFWKKCKALFNWADHNDYLKPSPFGTLPLRFDKSSESEKASSNDPLPVDKVNGILTYIGSTFKQDDWRRWPVILALTTGARAEEIVGLRTADVREINGVPAIDINLEARPSLKGESAERIIPVPEFIWKDLGFREYVESRKDAATLFDVTPDDTGKFYAKNYYYYMQKMKEVLKLGNRQHMHALRTTWKWAAENAEMPTELREKLFGHQVSTNSVSKTAYKVKDFIVPANKWQNAIQWKSLFDWKPLLPDS